MVLIREFLAQHRVCVCGGYEEGECGEDGGHQV